MNEKTTKRVPKTLLAWKIKDGLDPDVNFKITDTGVWRFTGKAMSTTKGIVKGLGAAILLAGIATGRSGSSGWGPASHYLSRDSQNKQFMSWRDIRNTTVNEAGRIILLQDKNAIEMRVCCRPETFEPAMTLIKERTATASKKKFCIQCGAKIGSGIRFCENCGAQIQG